MSKEQVMKSQGYAVEIEMILRNIFKCDRFGFGGQINSDTIRKHPYLSMTQGLAFLYATAEESKRKQIDEFIDKFSFYSDMSLDELLSFDTNEKVIGSITVVLIKNNGLEEVNYIISAFREVIK
ncbi:MAG: hypothetical protein J6K17_02430 [Oscillospiraceae bacterium]|nr:hypothetical protein [Oscillospiraceae bacterium]